MHILIAAASLAAVARTAARAVRQQRNSRFPILNCCRLTAGGDLAGYATDLDTAIAATATADVVEPGEACVDAHRLAEIASKIKGGATVETTEGRDQLTIRCGRSRFTLSTHSAEDYPLALEIDDGVPSTEVSAADVVAIFAGAAAASARGSERIYLAGPAIFSELKDDAERLCAAGTDAIALSYAATAAACPDLGAGVIVHRDTCKLAVDLFGKTGAVMRVSKNLVELRSESVRLCAKLVDALPVTWRSMVPAMPVGNNVLVKRVDLQNALEQCAAVFTNLPYEAGQPKRAPSVRIRWSAAGEDVRVSYGAPGAEWSALITIPDQSMSGKADVSVSPIMLMRLLEDLQVPELTDIDQLEGLEADSICLSTGGHPGDPLRIDASADRFAVIGQMREFAVEDEAA
jgi:DNA polymerase III sliding clamp (beta) subunit (PCNA family)